jgi:hypothetical protein
MTAESKVLVVSLSVIVLMVVSAIVGLANIAWKVLELAQRLAR